MKTIISNILLVTLTIIASILYSPVYCSMKVWLIVSRRILKPHFDIETRMYRKWHTRRSARIQKALDREHNKNIIKSLA